MAPPTNANPTMNLVLPGYDASGNQVNVAVRVTNITTDPDTGVVYGDLTAITTPSGTGTQGVNIAQYGGTNTSLGQKVKTDSIPVVLASNTDTIPSNITQIGSINVQMGDSSGTPVLSNSMMIVPSLFDGGTALFPLRAFNADGASGAFIADAGISLYNGTNNDRWRSSTVGDAISTGLAATQGYMYNGTNSDRMRGDTTNGLRVNNATDGLSTTAVAAGTAANTVIKASAGRLARVLITLTGTASMLIYDNATTNSGTLIGVIPANPTAGQVFEFKMPAASGITVDGDANNPGVTISWT